MNFQCRLAGIVPAVNQIELFEFWKIRGPLEVYEYPKSFDLLDATNHGSVLRKADLPGQQARQQ